VGHWEQDSICHYLHRTVLNIPRRRKTKQCHLEGKKSRHCREAMAIAAVPVPMKHQSSLVGGFNHLEKY